MEISLKSDRENHSVIQHYIGMSMNQMRHLQVDRLIEKHHIHSFMDLGCSQGLLIQKLARSQSIRLIVGVDCDESAVSSTVFNTYPENIQQTIQYSREHDQHIYIYKGDATRKYPELKSKNVQLVTMVEVIQHVPPSEISKVIDNVFGYLQPQLCFISTPNKEFNVFFEFEEGQMRHWDHKFQWTREEFTSFCEGIKNQYGYDYSLGGVGEHVSDCSKGFCTQHALFIRPANFIPAIEETFCAQDPNDGLQQRAHYQNKCWRSNIQKIMRNMLYKTLYYQKDITFEDSVQFISKQPIGICLQKEGKVVVDRELILAYLQENNEVFEWDEQRYRVKQQIQSQQDKNEQENEGDQPQQPQDEGFMMDESIFYSYDLSISNSNLLQKDQDPIQIE